MLKKSLLVTFSSLSLFFASCNQNPISSNASLKTNTVAVNLSWTPPSDSISFYMIERSISKDSIRNWISEPSKINHQDTTFIDTVSLSDTSGIGLSYRIYSVTIKDGNYYYYSVPSSITTVQL